MRLYEREMAAYCVLRGIDYIVEECPMADGNRHLHYKEALNGIEERSPGSKFTFYFGFLEPGRARVRALGRRREGRPGDLPHLRRPHARGGVRLLPPDRGRRGRHPGGAGSGPPVTPVSDALRLDDGPDEPTQDPDDLERSDLEPVASGEATLEGPWPPRSGLLRAGERVVLTDTKHRRYLVTLTPEGEFHSHSGPVRHADLIGRPEGILARSPKGMTYRVLRPTLADFVLKMPRGRRR